jgi:uncharacterized protein YndB with AHSA1/START domain
VRLGGDDDPADGFTDFSGATVLDDGASNTSSTSSSGSSTDDEAGASDEQRVDGRLVRDPLDDDDVGPDGARIAQPDLVVGDAGEQIELAPRLLRSAAEAAPEDVRWTQIGGTPTDVETGEGGVLRVRLPEVFVEEELVFSVELYQGGERVVQEITVQVQPVALTTRSLSIDEVGQSGLAAEGDGSAAHEGRGLGKVWGAMLAFLAAQSGRKQH